MIKSLKRIGSISICILLALTVSACGKEDKTPQDDTPANVAVARDETQTKAAVEKIENEDSDKEKDEEKTVKAEDKEKEPLKGSKKETDKPAPKEKEKSQKEKKKKEKPETAKEKKPSGHVLTIKKGSKTIYYSEQDLKNMGTVSYRYSFRNKNSSQRQFETFTGVKISTLLSKNDMSGSTIRVIASDGYTREYSVSDLKSLKKAFKKTTGTSAIDVTAIITTSGSESFRLCFGQREDDSDDNADYNMQYWAKNIITIDVY